MFKHVAAIFFLFAITGCLEKTEHGSHTHYFVGSDWFMKSPHHEELVRLASMQLNDYAKKEVLPIDDFGIRGKDSYNPIVRGNYLTDIPEDTRPGEYDLAEYYELDAIEDIFWDRSLQSIHFIRDEIDGEYLDTQTTCERAVKSLEKDARYILENWYSDPNYAFNIMGHLSHSIQDSTSKGHIRRVDVAGLGEKRISDICSFYPTENHCNHISNLEADNVWKNLWQAIKGEVSADGSYGNLKESAQLGVELTFEAWRVIYDAIKNGPMDQDQIDLFIKSDFASFLKNPNRRYSGYFLCPNDLLY
jgi:hypothetical protein